MPANIDPSAAELQRYLSQHHTNIASKEMYANFRLAWPDAAIAFRLENAQLRWLTQVDAVDVTFWFPDANTIKRLLSTSTDPYGEFMALFMAGQLRADGYLTWSTLLLTLFRPTPSPTQSPD